MVIYGAQAWYDHLVNCHGGGGPFGRLQHPEYVPRKRYGVERERPALVKQLKGEQAVGAALPPPPRSLDACDSDDGKMAIKKIAIDMDLINPLLH
jgi:hypothetical protein